MFKFEITELQDGMILRDFLFDELNFSNRLVKKAKSSAGGILVNDVHRTVRYQLKKGDKLEITLPAEEKSKSVQPENIPLSIVYEDEFIIIVDKPPGMPTIPSRLHPTGTVANGLLYYYYQQEIPYTIHIVTRLDKGTSGLLLVAKHQYAHSLLANLQRKGAITRMYQAVIHGHLTKKSGTIDAPIGRNPESIIERMVTEKGKRAITHYEVMQETTHYSLVQIRLETGRTHQIRVHFSSLGHPLVGDDLYGGKIKNIKRQALHCAHICFKHPFTHKEIQMNSSLPEDMEKLISMEKRA